VLATADLRERLVSEAYARWRESVRKEKCDVIAGRIGASRPNPEIRDPCEDTPPKTETPTDEGAEPGAGDAEEEIDETAIEEIGSIESMSPEIVMARINARGLALAAAVDAYMADNPLSAVLVDYRGPESVDGAMLARIARQPNGAHVREKLADYMSEIMMAVWIVSEDDNEE
jgi:hypothetical protein